MRHSIYAAAARRGMWRKAGGFDSRRIQPHSRLKWLNSLYRPALPEENRGNAIVPPLSSRVNGASPSGKAVDFDSTMRRFESSRPSQAVTQLEIVGPRIR